MKGWAGIPTGALGERWGGTEGVPGVLGQGCCKCHPRGPRPQVRSCPFTPPCVPNPLLGQEGRTPLSCPPGAEGTLLLSQCGASYQPDEATALVLAELSPSAAPGDGPSPLASGWASERRRCLLGWRRRPFISVFVGQSERSACAGSDTDGV